VPLPKFHSRSNFVPAVLRPPSETSSEPRRKSLTGVREWPDENHPINKQNKVWAADAIAEGNRWRETIQQRRSD
jgi:hypothetical protein